MVGAENQGFSIINTLLHACLLDETSNTCSVKLHDVVRDMTLWITGEMGEMKGKFLVQTRAGLTEAPDFVKWTTAERISLMANRIEMLTGSPRCPNLSTLLLDLNSDLHATSTGFFQFMPNLRVLSLSDTKIAELPSDVFNLVSLQYLNLSGTEIKKLPVEMKNLTKLKSLKLFRTFKLCSIPPGLISSLSMLQMVNIYRCGFYESDGNESLVEELASLKYLATLRTTIATAAVFEAFLSSGKLLSCSHALCLKIFNDSISLNISSLQTVKLLTWLRFEDFDSLREIKCNCAGKSGNLSSKVESFHGLGTVYILRCRVLKNLTWLTFAPNLKFLTVEECGEMEEVIGKCAEGGNMSPFGKLMRLKLFCLPELKSVCRSPLPFLYLERIFVGGCPKLKKLPLNSSSAKGNRCVIRGEGEWWNEIEWEDEATLNAFFPYFEATSEQGA